MTWRQHTICFSCRTYGDFKIHKYSFCQLKQHARSFVQKSGVTPTCNTTVYLRC